MPLLSILSHYLPSDLRFRPVHLLLNSQGRHLTTPPLSSSSVNMSRTPSSDSTNVDGTPQEPSDVLNAPVSDLDTVSERNTFSLSLSFLFSFRSGSDVALLLAGPIREPLPKFFGQVGRGIRGLRRIRRSYRSHPALTLRRQPLRCLRRPVQPLRSSIRVLRRLERFPGLLSRMSSSSLFLSLMCGAH